MRYVIALILLSSPAFGQNRFTLPVTVKCSMTMFGSSTGTAGVTSNFVLVWDNENNRYAGYDMKGRLICVELPGWDAENPDAFVVTDSSNAYGLLDWTHGILGHSFWYSAGTNLSFSFVPYELDYGYNLDSGITERALMVLGLGIASGFTCHLFAAILGGWSANWRSGIDSLF